MNRKISTSLMSLTTISPTQVGISDSHLCGAYHPHRRGSSTPTSEAHIAHTGGDHRLPPL